MKNRSVISKSAQIGDCFQMGSFSMIGENVLIGNNVIIGNNVTIYNDTQIGNNIRIDDNTVIGKLPMKVKTSSLNISGKLEPCIIKDNCIIGNFVVLYRGCSIGSECLIADLSSIREDVTIDNNTIIGRGVSIENCCSIGAFCKLETNAYITAYSEIEDYAFIAPGIVTTNDRYAARQHGVTFKGVTVKKGGRVGAQATILPEVIIYENGFAAAGSVVTKNIPKNEIHCGNPAKYMKDVPLKQQI